MFPDFRRQANDNNFIFFELWLTRFQMIACLAELALASVLRALSTRVMFITSSTLTPASTAAPALTPARWAPSIRLSNQASQDFRRGRPKVLVVLLFFRAAGQYHCTHFRSIFLCVLPVNIFECASGQCFCAHFQSTIRTLFLSAFYKTLSAKQRTYVHRGRIGLKNSNPTVRDFHVNVQDRRF